MKKICYCSKLSRGASCENKKKEKLSSAAKRNLCPAEAHLYPQIPPRISIQGVGRRRMELGQVRPTIPGDPSKAAGAPDGRAARNCKGKNGEKNSFQPAASSQDKPKPSPEQPRHRYSVLFSFFECDPVRSQIQAASRHPGTRLCKSSPAPRAHIPAFSSLGLRTASTYLAATTTTYTALQFEQSMAPSTSPTTNQAFNR